MKNINIYDILYGFKFYYIIFFIIKANFNFQNRIYINNIKGLKNKINILITTLKI